MRLRRATCGPRQFVVGGGLTVLVSGAACLSALRAPALCPAPAEHSYCSPTLVLPDGGLRDDGGQGCVCPEEPQRDCACTVDTCAARASSSCYPPPDCPPAVRQAAPRAACLDSKQDSIPTPGNLQCFCGCASCAGACDGEGFVLGPSAQQGEGTTLSLTLLGNIPASGSLGAMVRARGRGTVTLSTVTGSGSLQPARPLGTISVNGTEFADSIASGYTWATAASGPDVLLLKLDSQSSIEIDCVVPYVAP